MSIAVATLNTDWRRKTRARPKPNPPGPWLLPKATAGRILEEHEDYSDKYIQWQASKPFRPVITRFEAL